MKAVSFVLMAGVVTFAFFGAIGLMWNYLTPGWATLGTVTWVIMGIAAVVAAGEI
jgi:hypothetical protein